MLRLCKDCVNWLCFDEKNIECDYDIFKKCKIETAITFVPEIFDCEYWEKKPIAKE